MSLLRFTEPHIYAPVDDSLVLWISGRGRSVGSKVFDLSKKSNHSTIHGACWKSLPSGYSVLSFDGIDDYCYDEATEVLTLRGWVSFKELTLDDFVATLNPATNELEYQRPKRLISYYYEGKMVKVSGRHIDLLVTPNHRMFVSVNKEANIWDEYKLLPAKEILDRKVRYKKDCVWKGKRVEFFELPSVIYKINQHKAEERDVIKIPMDDWLEFFGYYISEGYCKYDEERSQYSVVIAQSLAKKEKIEECLKRLPFKFSYRDGKFCIKNKQLASYLKQFGKSEDRFIPSWIKQLAPDQLRILLDALMYGDGHRNQYYTKSKKLADDVQEIAFKVGFSADVSYWSNHKPTIYCVGIQKTNIHPTVGERRNGVSWNLAKHELVDYSGMVYCCEVPKYHIIYVRRNGKAVWSGNCEVADSQSLALNTLTVILWVAGGYQTDDWANVVDKIDVNNVGWAIDVSGNGPKMRVRIDTSAVQNQIFYIGEALDEKWHQVAVVIENGEIRGYLDAQNTLQDVYEVGDGITCAKPLRIGNRSDNMNCFKGLIGEVHIYNRALSASEIRELYNKTKHLYGY